MNFFNLFKKHEPVSAPVSEPAPSANATSRRIHNLIILDESGSMYSIYSAALSGVNETLQTIRQAQKDHANQSHFVTLVSFSSSRYNEIYHDTPADKAADINERQYQPGGCTPLFDAMGRALTELRTKVADGDVVLVTVVTDGEENSSTEYDGRAIKALIEELKKRDWVFTYIGANQNVEAVAASMSIDNHLSFNATDEEIREMWQKESTARKRFFDRAATSEPMATLSKNYFDL